MINIDRGDSDTESINLFPMIELIPSQTSVGSNEGDIKHRLSMDPEVNDFLKIQCDHFNCDVLCKQMMFST